MGPRTFVMLDQPDELAAQITALGSHEPLSLSNA
jgi:hypothetical protein